MKLETALEIYNLIISSKKNLTNKAIQVRKKALNNLLSNNMVKVAFDTRRINQETDYIPRRGLQNYHRSEKFISEALSKKIASFKKINNILEELKSKYGREPEWQDSYARILYSSINKSLNVYKEDFSDTQPSMSSFNYLDELMYVRYRLTPEDIEKLSEQELKNRILSKDENLFKIGDAVTKYEVLPSDVSKYSYDEMVNKMLSTMAQVMSQKSSIPEDNLTNKLFDVKATKDSPEVERTVTITIKDKIVEGNIQKISERDNSSEKIINKDIEK